MRTEPDGTITYFPLDSEHSEVAVAWYLELPQNAGNIMGMVFRDGQDKPWKSVIRTRQYRDDKNDMTSKDKRHGYMVTAKDDEQPDAARQRLIKSTDKFFSIIMDTASGRLYRLDEHKSIEEFMTIWGTQPWSHMTTEPAPKP